MTSTLIMRREEEGGAGGTWTSSSPPSLSSPRLQHRPAPPTTLWGGNPKTVAAQLATAMPTPPESPPPGHPDHCPAVHTNGLVDETTTRLGLHNLLRVSTANSDRYLLTRRCCYAFHCIGLRTKFHYPHIPNKLILRDERVVSAVEQMVTEELEAAGQEEEESRSRSHAALLARHTARVHRILNDMKAAISSTLIRITGYVLFKVFSNLLMSVTVHGGQQEVVERAARQDTPVIFVPLHRSHVDYLFVTWVLFNRQIPAPIVAAGDNLRIPVFGWLLRGLGGFFIKRRLDTNKSRKDVVYRAVLQTYMSNALQAGYNLEFFIEGGRTRTGKPCMPKGGLLSVIVDAYNNGTLDDALIVPIAINYDKLLDGNFIREQMGQSKVPESFWGAVRAIIKVLSTNFGHARIDFGQPFSLREFIRNTKGLGTTRLGLPQNTSEPQLSGYTPPASPTPPDDSPITESLPLPTLAASPSSTPGKGHQRTLSTPNTTDHQALKRSLSNPSSALNTITKCSSSHLMGARSNSSLFGSEMTEEYRTFVKSLANHIVYDAERCQAIMSTNAVAWLLSYVYREGTTMTTLTTALDALRLTLRSRHRDTGFSGHSTDVIHHATGLLGAGLVRVESETENSAAATQGDLTIRPVTLLPNVIELNYYASALTPLFAADAIVVTSLLTLIDCDLWSYKDCSPDCIVDREKLVRRAGRLAELLQHEFLLAPPCGRVSTTLQQATNALVDMSFLQDAGKGEQRRWSEDSDDEGQLTQYYKVCPSAATLEVVGAWKVMLAPMLDAYYHTARTLTSLVDKQMSDKQFIQTAQATISSHLDEGTLHYGESICVDPIRNAVKLFEGESIVESYTQDSIRLLYLTQAYNSEDRLGKLTSEIDSFRL